MTERAESNLPPLSRRFLEFAGSDLSPTDDEGMFIGLARIYGLAWNKAVFRDGSQNPREIDRYVRKVPNVSERFQDYCRLPPKALERSGIAAIPAEPMKRMLRSYPEAPFDAWICDNQPGFVAQYDKGWWDAVEFVRYLQGQFPVEAVTIVGDFDMETPPPTEILRMPIFLLRLPGIEICLKNDFSALEPYWGASVVIHDDRTFAAYGLPAPLDRWKRDLRDTFPSEWRFPPHSPESRRFSCGLANEHSVFALFWLLTHTPDSPYSDAWDDVGAPGRSS